MIMCGGFVGCNGVVCEIVDVIVDVFDCVVGDIVDKVLGFVDFV